MRFHEYYTKSQRVQHPGIRGGIGYWDGKGNWRYGIRPEEHPTNEGQYRAESASPPISDRLRVREVIRSAKPLGPKLASVRSRMEALGYDVRESVGIANEPFSVRLATFNEICSAMELLHQAIPGLTNVVRSAGLRLIVNSKVEHLESASGYFEAARRGWPDPPLIVIDNNNDVPPGHVFFHELGHALDNALAQRGESAKIGTTRGASELTNHPVRALVGGLKKTKEHKDFVREIESYEPGSRPYMASYAETFARGFAAYATYLFQRYGRDPASRLAEPDFHEIYKPVQLEQFGDELRRIFRLYGLDKSFRRLTSWRW